MDTDTSKVDRDELLTELAALVVATAADVGELRAMLGELLNRFGPMLEEAERRFARRPFGRRRAGYDEAQG